MTGFRVFLSSTSKDLGKYRVAVIETIRRQDHQAVHMERWTAGDRTALEKSLSEVAACDLYVGIIARSYGSKPKAEKLSFTQLEYEKAVENGIPAIFFLLDGKVKWPAEHTAQGEDAELLAAFVDKIREKVVDFFTDDPLDLRAKAADAIANAYKGAIRTKPTKADVESLQRIMDLLRPGPHKGGRKEKAHRDRVVGPVPEARIRHFQDRIAELRQLHGRLTNEGLRVVLVCGRGGSGKTALIAKLIRRVEQDWLAKTAQDGKEEVDSIVFVQLAETESRSLDVIVELVARTFEPDKAGDLLEKWKNKRSVADGLDMLFNQALRQARRLIVLDNFETVLDDANRIREEFAPLRQFIEACLEFRHAALLLATSRRSLVLSPEVEGRTVGLRDEVSLDAGLPADAAKTLLRELDPDGSLGAKNAPDELLEDVVRRCGCIPRTLENLVGVLLADRTWTLATYVSDEARFSQFIDDPERVLYASLPSDDDRRVMEVLSVYNRPVPAAAVRHILPALPVEAILNRFRLNHVATCGKAQFSLHPLDREYAYGQIPEEGESYSRRALHQHAAHYYRSLPCPDRAQRASIDDIQPLLHAFEHLLAAGNAEEAATLFIDEGIHDELYWWGHYLLLTDLCSRILNRKVSPTKKILLHVLLGKVHRNFGELDEAKRIYTEALPLLDQADQESEIRLLIALGDISYYMGELDRALEYHRRAEELLAANPNPTLDSENSGDLANALLGQGRDEEARQYYERAIALSRESGMRTYEGIWHGGLGNLHSAAFSRSQDPVHRDLTISHYHDAIAIAKETKDARHNSHWNGVLGNFYRQLGEFELAEAHLRDALVISSKIRYVRGMQTQVPWLTAVFRERARSYLETWDFEAALAVAQAFRQTAVDIGMDELDTEAEHQIDELRLIEFGFLFREGRVDEAIAKGREFLVTCSGKVEAYDGLGMMAMRWGRLAGSRDSLLLSAEAYGTAIGVSPEETLSALYAGRADAHALLGMAEEAIADYGEVIRRDPQNTGAALSQAEVRIWLGQYDAARVCLEALRPKLTATREEAIGAWLMCHALNLNGRDFSAYRAVLEEIAERGNVELEYGVRDIEPYLDRLDPARFNQTQIADAWMVQSLILKITGA